MRLYVARHGETDWNQAGRYQGQRESSLTQRGIRQARALAQAFYAADTDLDALFTSPLSRCRDTAREFDRYPFAPVVDARLIEIAHGDWEGRLRESIERDDAERFLAWREQPETVRFPGGESLDDVRARWRAFIAGLDGYEAVAVITHDVLVRIAVLGASNRGLDRLWEPRVVNGGYAVLDLNGGAWALVEECHDAHLDGLVADVSRQAL